VIGVPFPHDACAMIEDSVVRLLWRIGDAMPIQLRSKILSFATLCYSIVGVGVPSG
jgi:hypothetical protein